MKNYEAAIQASKSYDPAVQRVVLTKLAEQITSSKLGKEKPQAQTAINKAHHELYQQNVDKPVKKELILKYEITPKDIDQTKKDAKDFVEQHFAGYKIKKN